MKQLWFQIFLGMFLASSLMKVLEEIQSEIGFRLWKRDLKFLQASLPKKASRSQKKKGNR